MTGLAAAFPAADPADLPAAYLLALVKAHAADDGDRVDALLALAAGGPAVATFAGTYNEKDHPRGDDGHFVSKDHIADAAGDPAAEAELRKTTTKPAERQKLDTALDTAAKAKGDTPTAADEAGKGEPAPVAPTPDAPPAKAPKPTPRPAVADTLATIRGHLGATDTSLHGPGTADKIAAAIGNHTHAELAEIRKELGIKAGGKKADVIAKMATRAALGKHDRSDRSKFVNARMTADEAHDALKAHLDAPEIDHDALAALGTRMAEGLSVKDLGEVKKRLGLRAGGGKQAMVDKLVRRAVSADAARKAAPTPTHAGTLADGSPVAFTPHPKQAAHETTVAVHPAALDAGFAKSPNQYIPPGGGGPSSVPGRREGFEAFLKTGQPVQASRASLDPATGAVDFADGRHRFSVLRDRGADKVAVTVAKDQAAEFSRRFGQAPAAPKSPVGVDSSPTGDKIPGVGSQSAAPEPGETKVQDRQDSPAAFTRPVPADRVSPATGKTFAHLPAESRGDVSYHASQRDDLRGLSGYDESGRPQFHDWMTSGPQRHGAVAAVGKGKTARVFGATARNGEPVVAWAEHDAKDVGNGAALLRAAGLDPAEHMGDVAARHFGTGTAATFEQKTRDYLKAGGVEPPDKAPPKPRPTPAPDAPKKFPGGQIDGDWDPSMANPNGGGMSYNSRRLKHGGEVIPVGGDHPHGVVTGVDVGKTGKVTYAVRPHTPAELGRMQARADAGSSWEAASAGGVKARSWPAAAGPQPEWSPIDPMPRVGSFGKPVGERRHVGTLADGRPVGRIDYMNANGVATRYAVPPEHLSEEDRRQNARDAAAGQGSY